MVRPNKDVCRHKLLMSLIAWTLIGCFPSSAVEADLPKADSFGATKAGEAVEIFTLTNGKVTAKVMTYGATLVELHAPDRNGKMADVVLGFDDVAGYQSNDNQFFGCTTGRVCNRIANGRFVLDGITYSLAINNEPNHLHGGSKRSLDKVVWKATPLATEKGQGVQFTYTSPDGEEGYPGNVEFQVTYFVPKNQPNLRIDYRAKTDKKTPINLTNHSYFNLAGAGNQTVLDHLLKIGANNYTPTDDTLIPTGQLKSVEGTPLDFRQPTRIGDRIAELVESPTKGYDHNFALNSPDKGKAMRLAAMLHDPASGRKLRIMTTEPGVQFYSGNFLMGQTGKDGKSYPHQSAVCLETQHFPDSVNQPDFPSTILSPDREYSSRTVFHFGLEGNQKKKEVKPVNVPIEVDVTSVKSDLDAGNIILIDCREISEWELAKIEGSILIPMSSWMESTDQLSEFKGRRIVVHCHHGGRSLRATNWLRANGFPDAQNMTGGIHAWSLEVDQRVPQY